MVERLHIERPAWPDPEGELVRYSDYATLTARVEELTREASERHALYAEQCEISGKLQRRVEAAEASNADLYGRLRETEARRAATSDSLSEYEAVVREAITFLEREVEIRGFGDDDYPPEHRAGPLLLRLTATLEAKI